MSLERFMQGRIVAQSPETCIYDAIRAMQDNHIGAVLVHDGESLVGVVTDRDLACKLAELEVDPFESCLAEVMSTPVACVGRDVTVVDVAALMIAHGVRRIPIIEGAAILGVVTLDDLILEHAVDTFTLAAIVRAQLAEPAKLKSAGRVHPVSAPTSLAARDARHEARVQQKYVRLLKSTMDSTGLASREDAECALNTVLTGLLRRVSANEAADLLAQLPGRLRQYALRNVLAGPEIAISRGFIERSLAASLDIGPDRAHRIARQVARVIEQSVSPGEIAQFKGQLPSELRELFEAPAQGAVQAR